MAEVTNALKSEIRGLQDEIEKVVSNGIRDEIETIQQVVFDFDDAQFIHDQTVVHVYTQQLIRFVVVIIFYSLIAVEVVTLLMLS